MRRHLPRIGISSIGTYEPPWVLPNAWFGDTLPSKFVKHTGIESRRISPDDEVTMALRSVGDLERATELRWEDCAAVVFAASSLMPGAVCRRYPGAESLRSEGLESAARRFRRELGLGRVCLTPINWGCSGYPKALALARRQMLASVALGKNQFILVVTVNRTSAILDYSCRQTAGLFGDFSQATLLARDDSDRYPVHFRLVVAIAERCPASSIFFDYHFREGVPVPTGDGGRGVAPKKLVFSLDGMGIGDAAPRGMADAAERALRMARISPKNVNFVIPHQAGTGIVRLATMQLERLGVSGEVINGLVRDVANISSSSVPYALKREWNRLHGTVLCPTAGVGDPGEASITRGCVILQSTRLHTISVTTRGGLQAAS